MKHEAIAPPFQLSVYVAMYTSPFTSFTRQALSPRMVTSERAREENWIVLDSDVLVNKVIS